MKDKKIDNIFNILVQYEKMFEKNSSVTEFTYKKYLDRLFVFYTGYGEEEIAISIKGLYNLGASANHNTVRQIVFHIINILENRNSSE